MNEDVWNGQSLSIFPYPRITSLLGISVVMTLIIGILSQCYTVSSFMTGLPEYFNIVFLNSLILSGFFLGCNELGIIMAWFRINDWIANALSKTLGNLKHYQESETEEIRFILTQSYKKSRIDISLFLIGLVIIFLTIFIPLVYLNRVESTIQLGILLFTLVTTFVNTSFDILSRKLEKNYSEMHEHDLIDVVNSLMQKKSDRDQYEVEIDKTLRAPLSMKYNHLSYVLFFLWIGITDLLFLI